MSEALPFDRMSVATISEESDQLSHAYVIGVEVPGWNVGDVFDLTQSVNQWSIRNRRGHMLGDHAGGLGKGAQDTESIARSSGLLSGLTVPLVWNDQVIGTFNLRSKRANAYSKADLEFAERAGAQVAGAIANAQLNASLQRESTERQTLATIGRIISSTLDMDETYRRFAEELRKLGVDPSVFRLATPRHRCRADRSSWERPTGASSPRSVGCGRRPRSRKASARRRRPYRR